MIRRMPTALTLSLLLAIAPACLSAQAAPRQTSADGYTRYELQEPGSGAFHILYDITATTPGATVYLNGIREGADEVVHAVTDPATGQPLEWQVVDADVARTQGIPRAADGSRYIQVTLPRPVATGGEARVHIDKTYVDRESYFTDGSEIVFDRTLGVPRNTVVLPAGYELVSVNVPSQVDTEADGRIRVSFLNSSGLSLRYLVRARPLPPAAARALAANAVPERPAPERPVSAPDEGGGYDGSYARTDRTFDERAALSREIVYYLEQPESHAFTLYHDYTESRPGQDRYVNVVRAGSAAADPRAYLLDTGEELAVETLEGDEVVAAGVMRPDQVDASTEVVLIHYPEVTEGTTARLRIHETYTDPGRYLRVGDELVWDRNFGRSMNQVVLPQGWYLTASDIPATVDALDDGRVRLTFWNGGPQGIQVFLRARARRPPVATSLSGEKLYPRPDPDPAALARVDSALLATPGDVDALIAAARERRNSFRYDEAILLYTRALQIAPEDWRPWRFRGHRFLSTRRFEDAARDLERARELAPYNFDVAYHLGLAYYLLGRFGQAVDAYQRCLDLAADPDARAREDSEALAGQQTCMAIAHDDEAKVAITEWTYRALRRAGRRDDAMDLLDDITPDMQVTENTAYHEALLAHKGVRSAEDLVVPEPPEGRFETRAYGPALDELLDGDSERALLLLRRIAADPNWPGFGRLAAEADLARGTLGGGGSGPR